MKKIIIAILAAASALFASCSSDSPSLSNDGEDINENSSQELISRNIEVTNDIYRLIEDEFECKSLDEIASIDDYKMNTSYKVNLENMPDYYNIYEKSSAMGKVLTHFIH